MNKNYRIIFIGAGFSKPAGLPLGQELFDRIKQLCGDYPFFKKDLNYFLDYKRNTSNSDLKIDDINFEEFMGFLDIKHYLRLEGSETWDYEEGNKSQLVIRNAIGKILSDATPEIDQLFKIYENFIDNLTINDIIITFNYDNIIEQLLDYREIPYTLVEPELGKITILKLHGSIDWFNSVKYKKALEYNSIQLHADIHRIPHNNNLCKLYKEHRFLNFSPLILSPSSQKIFYVKPLIELWHGIATYGMLSRSIGIIGYSLPNYDSYIQQVIYQIVENFVAHKELPDGRIKSKIKIIDFRETDEMKKELREVYKFIDDKYLDINFNGLGDKTIDWFFEDTPM